MKEPAGTQDRDPDSRILMFLVCTGLFMIGLSIRSILIALPTLAQFFQTDLSVIQWALLAYDLATVGLVLTLGALGDVIGRKKIYISGFLLFSVGSALCAFAQTPGQLIAFRIIQGIGGAMILANGRSIIVASVPLGQRGQALGLTSMALHIGFLVGPTLSGFLIDFVSWRWIFFLNVPLGLAAAFCGGKILQEQRLKHTGDEIDIAGAGYLLLSASTFVYAVNEIPVLGMGHYLVVSFLFVSATALALFLRTELHAASPILRLSLFRLRVFTETNVALFFVTFTQSSVGLLMTFFLHHAMGLTASQMGWILITNSAAIIVSSPLSGRLSDRFGSRALCSVGAALLFAGQYLIASLTLHSSLFDMIFPLVLSGVGWAAFNAPNQTAMLRAVPPDQIGAASGMNVTTGRLGGILGISMGTALFTYLLGGESTQALSHGSWNADPEAFLKAFRYTAHALNLFGLIAVFFSMRSE